jgi:hypothetical protein
MTCFVAGEEMRRSRLAVLLVHFPRLDAWREQRRVMYPLSGMLLLLELVPDRGQFHKLGLT